MADYNFFGQAPGQQNMAASPQSLAQAMQLQDYNNATPNNTQQPQGGGMGSIDPKMLAKMMQSQTSGVPLDAQAAGIPANAMSYNTGAGPLPWLPQNALPWSGS